MPEAAAARFDDPVAHSHALGGFIAGALIGVAAAIGVAMVVGAVATAVAAEVVTGGLATPLVAGIAVTLGELAVNLVAGGWLTQKAEQLGESLGSQSFGSPSGKIAQGSATVIINDKPAARVTDKTSCDDSPVAQGSDCVFINGQPAARLHDKLNCGGAIIEASPNVFIGGGTITVGSVASEVPSWVRWAAIILPIIPAIGGLARALGPALAEIEAQGFSRALQSGAKAVGRAMEERAGGVRGAPETTAPEQQLSLPKPSPSRYLVDQEPPVPAGGKASISGFTAERPGLDVNNLSPADQDAADAMERAGWDGNTQAQVLNSGDNFSVVDGKAGDPMYKFSSAGRDEASGAPSAYYTDQAGFDNLQDKYYDGATNSWDSPGIKNELALPCYNSANSVWRGTLGSDQPLTSSTINPATETVTMMNPDGSVSSVFQRTMQGGGGQITPAKGGVVGLAPFDVSGNP